VWQANITAPILVINNSYEQLFIEGKIIERKIISQSYDITSVIIVISNLSSTFYNPEKNPKNIFPIATKD